MRVNLRAEEGEGLGIKVLVGPDTACQSLEALAAADSRAARPDRRQPERVRGYTP